MQSKKVVSSIELAKRFDISVRTVYRDIRALEEAGVPIGTEPGKGYYIMEGYRLPPVMFTRSEANALILAEKLIEKFSDDSVSEEFKSAVYKIKSVLRTDEKEGIENLETKISVYVPPREEPANTEFLPKIKDALASQRVLRMEYYSNYNEERTKREVEPIGLIFYASAWHLIAYCRLRNGYRDFRTSRIHSLQILDEVCNTKRSITLEQYVDNMMFEGELTKASIRVKRDVVRYMTEQKYYQGFIEERDLGEWIEMDFLVHSFELFGRWLLMYGDAVEVLNPPEMLKTIENLAREIAGHYLRKK